MSALVAVRPAPRLDSYPLLPDRGEDTVSSPCACGEALRLRPGDATGYAAHVAGSRHQAWRARVEYAAGLVDNATVSVPSPAGRFTLIGARIGAPYDQVAETNRTEAPTMHPANPACACWCVR